MSSNKMEKKEKKHPYICKRCDDRTFHRHIKSETFDELHKLLEPFINEKSISQFYGIREIIYHIQDIYDKEYTWEDSKQILKKLWDIGDNIQYANVQLTKKKRKEIARELHDLHDKFVLKLQ